MAEGRGKRRLQIAAEGFGERRRVATNGAEVGGRREAKERYIWREGKKLSLPSEEDPLLLLEEDAASVAVAVVH